MMTEHSIAVAEGQTTKIAALSLAVLRAQDTLGRVGDLNRLLSMAGEGLFNSLPEAVGIVAGCDIISDLLSEVRAQLDMARAEANGGAA